MEIIMDVAVADSLVPLKTLMPEYLSELFQESESFLLFPGEQLDPQTDPSVLDFLLSGELIWDEGPQKGGRVSASQCFLPLSEQFPNAGVLVAQTDCQLLKVARDRLDQLLTWSQVAEYLMLALSEKNHYSDSQEWIIDLLKSNLFQKVPPVNLLEIVDKFEPRPVNAGEAVVREGEFGDRFYFIETGEAEVRRYNPELRQAVQIARIGAGRCFGEDALIHATTRNATVVMLTSGVLMQLHKSQFLSLIREPDIPKVSLKDDDTSRATIFDERLVLVVDVRTTEEYESGHIQGAVNIPLSLLRLKQRMLNMQQPLLLYCNSGCRSAAAAKLLNDEGYQVSYVEGGVSREAFSEYWSWESLPLRQSGP